MTCTQALLSLLLVAPCSDGGGQSMDVAIAEALASPERIETDRLRDPMRKPDQVLAFFEIKPGMRVLDLFSGGGYYTEILSRLVGPSGSVVTHNNQAYLDYVKDEVAVRYADQRLASPERIETDRLRDPMRKPDQVLAFFEIKPGMRVLDLFSGGGYYTEILSRLVGPGGSVVTHNNQAYLDYVKDEVAGRYADQRLANVSQLTAEANDMVLDSNSFDATLAILTWHDFYYSDDQFNWPDVDEKSLVEKLCSAMKPGAVLGIIDHAAEPGADARQAGQELHRADPQRIQDDLAGSCFELEAEAMFLRNPEDQPGKVAMDPAVRGKTDRVVYKYRRNKT